MFFSADYLDLRNGDSGVWVLIQHPQDQSPQRFTDLWSAETESKIQNHNSVTSFIEERVWIFAKEVKKAKMIFFTIYHYYYVQYLNLSLIFIILL